MSDQLEPLPFRYLREAREYLNELAGWRNDFRAIAEALGLPDDVGRADLVYAAAELKARVEHLNGQEATWARIAIRADCESDRLRERNTNQGLALAQAEHELAQLQARRALVLDWCEHLDTPARYAEHIRTLLGGEQT